MNNNRKKFNWAHLDRLGKFKDLGGPLFNSIDNNIAESKIITQDKYPSAILPRKDNINLNSYLAGLFEGDGHIWFPKPNMKKKNNPRFCITFGLKNEPLAKKITRNNRIWAYKI